MIRLEMTFFCMAVVCLGLHAQAAENSYCSDLATVSCNRAADTPDGTGTRYFKTPEQISTALMPAFARAKPKIDSAIMYGVSSSVPEGKGKNSLQAKAIRAYGLNLASNSGCQVVAPPDEKIRAEVQALSNEQKAEMMRTCNTQIRDLLFEHLKTQSLAGAHSEGVFPANASPQAMLDLETSVEFQSVLSFVEDEVEREALTGDLDKRIRELFPDVKKLMIARVRSMGLSAEDEERAVKKLTETTYRPGGCTMQLRNSRLYDANAYLSTNPEGKSTFSFCPSFLLSTDSEFSLVAVMAHEMAHAIDPCRMGSKHEIKRKEYDPSLEAIFDRESPIAPLIGCLRNAESVGAVSCSLNALKRRKEKCEKDPIECLIADKENAEKEDGTVTISSCNDDQIVEAVSDWFGVETLEAYMRERKPSLSREQFRAGVSNAFRPICYEEELENGAPKCESHPPSVKRIERIINANPRLRTRMGCSEKHPKGHLYCDRGSMPQNVLGGEGRSGDSAPSEQRGGIK